MLIGHLLTLKSLLLHLSTYVGMKLEWSDCPLLLVSQYFHLWLGYTTTSTRSWAPTGPHTVKHHSRTDQSTGPHTVKQHSRTDQSIDMAICLGKLFKGLECQALYCIMCAQRYFINTHIHGFVHMDLYVKLLTWVSIKIQPCEKNDFSTF